MLKWNGFKNEHLKLNLKHVEILKIIWFETGKYYSKFTQIYYYWNLFKDKCFKVEIEFYGKL